MGESIKTVDSCLQLLQRIKKHSDVDSRIHTHFNQNVANTFRITTSNPNLQNVNKDERFRKLFIADPGMKFIGADYDQFQLRIIADLALANGIDSGFAKVLKLDTDIHSYTAAYLSIDRDLAKRINFSVCYGMHTGTFQKILKCSEEEAIDIFDKWHKKFPEVKLLHSKYVEEIKKKGYVSSIYGQRRYFSVEKLSDFEIDRKGWVAFNSVVQMIESSIIKLAITDIYAKIKRKAYKCNLLLTVHDELLFQCHDNCCFDMVDIIHDCMVNFKLKVNLKVKIKVGSCWSEVH